MARQTQYIGLNDYAKKYLENANVLKEETYPMTVGMCGETVTGFIYCIEPKYPNTNEEERLIETVQDVKWSGGPMIFTCLRCELVKKVGQVLDMGEYFRWMMDPSIQNTEMCYKTGRYYV